jgi:hypothetical protein
LHLSFEKCITLFRKENYTADSIGEKLKQYLRYLTANLAFNDALPDTILTKVASDYGSSGPDEEKQNKK